MGAVFYSEESPRVTPTPTVTIDNQEWVMPNINDLKDVFSGCTSLNTLPNDFWTDTGNTINQVDDTKENRIERLNYIVGTLKDKQIEEILNNLY